MKDLYDENFKSLKKDQDTRKWKDIPHSPIDRINNVKITILPKAIYRSNVILIKISTTFFTEMGGTLEFKRIQKRLQVAKAILSKKRTARIDMQDFKI